MQCFMAIGELFIILGFMCNSTHYPNAVSYYWQHTISNYRSMPMFKHKIIRVEWRVAYGRSNVGACRIAQLSIDLTTKRMNIGVACIGTTSLTFV